MTGNLELPPWNLKKTSLIVVCVVDEFSFLKANPTAVHPSLTPPDTWELGFNVCDDRVTNARSSSKSQVETDIPGTRPAVLLLRELPKNGAAYIFGRGSDSFEPDVIIPNRLASRRQFCVYPNLLHRTWVVQDLSGKRVAVNDHTLSSNDADQALPWRALQYDCLNRVVFAQSAHYPGITLYIKPVWPEDSQYLDWEWADPSIPELAGLGLDSTITSPTPAQSQKLQLQQSNPSTIYCVLKRRLIENVDLFCGQNLATAEMLVAEKFPSGSKAKAQFDLRKNLKDPHLLQVRNIWLFEQPYILSVCPSHCALVLTDLISDDGFLHQREAYTLLDGLLSATNYLINEGLLHGDITSNNILVEDLSPKIPRFWLTGFASAKPVSTHMTETERAADVHMVVQMIASVRPGPKYFEDPIANDIFTETFQAFPDTTLTAKQILDRFNELTHGKGDFPFRVHRLTKVFAMEQFTFRDHTYYLKNDVARAIWAMLAHDVSGCQEAYDKVLRTKPSVQASQALGEELLCWEDAQKLIQMYSAKDCLDYPKLAPKWNSRTHCTRNFPISIHVTCYTPSSMWNLSRLVTSMRLLDPVSFGKPKRYVEVGGDSEFEGSYVDLETFRDACDLLDVSSPPCPKDTYSDPRSEEFLSVDSYSGDMVLVEEGLLLGAAIFKRSSRTMIYGGIELSEISALELSKQRNFKGLQHGLQQSGTAPQDTDRLWQAWPTQRASESQYESLTESEDTFRFTSRRAPDPTEGQAQSKNYIEEWVGEQMKRRRVGRSAVDTEPNRSSPPDDKPEGV